MKNEQKNTAATFHLSFVAITCRISTFRRLDSLLRVRYYFYLKSFILQNHLYITLFMCVTVLGLGPDSSVGMATELRAGRSGIESRCGRDFPLVQTAPGNHPASCKMGTGSFSGAKCDRGVLLTTHPLLVPRSWESRAIPLPTLWATLRNNQRRDLAPQKQ